MLLYCLLAFCLITYNFGVLGKGHTYTNHTLYSDLAPIP